MSDARHSGREETKLLGTAGSGRLVGNGQIGHFWTSGVAIYDGGEKRLPLPRTIYATPGDDVYNKYDEQNSNETCA